MLNRREQYLKEVDKVLISLAQKNNEKVIPNRIAFSNDGVKNGLFKKIAFDVYKVDNDPYENLWLLEEFSDGWHLVRSSEQASPIKTRGEWTAISDYDRNNVTLNYKNIPIARFSSTEFNFKPEEIFAFKEVLLEKVGEDTDFVKDILICQPQNKVEALVSTFPEFKKFIK